MFQDYALFPHLTVFENVAFGISNLSVGRRRWVRSALERMGLAAFARSYPHTLSGGQQQRCALLRALAPNPDVLLLDEPFSGLGPGLRAEMLGLVRRLAADRGKAVLMVTHAPEEARGMAELTAFCADGRIEGAVVTARLFAEPPAALAAYLGPAR
jgi:thiamine transport system ATP-binding protein